MGMTITEAIGNLLARTLQLLAINVPFPDLLTYFNIRFDGRV